MLPVDVQQFMHQPNIRDLLRRKYEHTRRQLKQPQSVQDCNEDDQLVEMLALWEAVSDDTHKWCKYFWDLAVLKHGILWMWYYICSNPHHRENDTAKFETFLNQHPNKKRGYLYGLPTRVRDTVNHFLTIQERVYVMPFVANNIDFAWHNTADPKWLVIWSQIMANEARSTTLFADLRKMLNDETLLRLLIFDQRIFDKSERDAVNLALNSETTTLIGGYGISDDSVDPFGALGQLHENLVQCSVGFCDMSSYLRLMITNSNYWCQLRKRQWLMKCAGMRLIVFDDQKYKNWDPSSSTYFVMRCVHDCQENYENEIPDARIMPTFNPRYLQSFYGNYYHLAMSIKPRLNFVIAVFNHDLAQNKINLRVDAQNCVYIASDNFGMHQRYSTTAEIFVCAGNGGITIGNLYSLLCSDKPKTIVMWNSRVLYDAPLRTQFDVASYDGTNDKHFIWVDTQSLHTSVVFVPQYDWFSLRIKKFTIVCHWRHWRYINNEMLDALINPQNYPVLEEVTIWGYIAQVPRNNWSINTEGIFNFHKWLKQNYDTIQSSRTITKFSCNVYVNELEKGDTFDICQMFTRADLEQRRTLWLNFQCHKSKEEVVNVLTDIVACFL